MRIVIFIFVVIGFVFSNELPEMVEVPSGSFIMGSKKAQKDSRPEHGVIVSSFKIAKSLYFTTKDSMSNISFVGAMILCNDLSKKNGLEPVYNFTIIKAGTRDNPSEYDQVDPYKVVVDLSKNGYRMPTEAEWEFALKKGFISFDSNRESSQGEWCNDLYDTDYYEISPQKDPLCLLPVKNNAFRRSYTENCKDRRVIRGVAKSLVEREPFWTFLSGDGYSSFTGLRLVQSAVVN